MADDWRTACWRAEREVDEYRGTIVPALVERVRELENRWVHVNEWKPEEFVSVLAYVPGMAPLPTVYEAYLAKGCWVTRTMILQDYEVTHWMEMPQGPGK